MSLFIKPAKKYICFCFPLWIFSLLSWRVRYYSWFVRFIVRLGSFVWRLWIFQQTLKLAKLNEIQIIAITVVIYIYNWNKYIYIIETIYILENLGGKFFHRTKHSSILSHAPTEFCIFVATRITHTHTPYKKILQSRIQ